MLGRWFEALVSSQARAVVQWGRCFPKHFPLTEFTTSRRVGPLFG